LKYKRRYKMAIAQATWTHGHSIQVELPQNGTVERRGFSARYLSSGARVKWLHFAIPTPVLVNDKRLRVASALVRFKCGTGGFVKAIHVYDGENRIAANDNLNLNFTEWHLERVDVLADPIILWGLGISINVNFGASDRWIEFSAAGCDLV